jgi:hypothetical protein
MITAEVRSIGPTEARSILERNDVNRRVRKRLVTAYATDMRAGRWGLTGETIVISRTGSLLDGQHRMHAVIDSGRKVRFLVATGSDDDVQRYMDQGASRTVADAAKILGIANTALTSSIARWYCLMPVPGPGMAGLMRRKVPVGEQLTAISENPDLVEAAAFAVSVRKDIPGSPTALGYSWLALHRVDPADCRIFFDAMRDMSFKAQNDQRRVVLKSIQGIDRDSGPSSNSTDKAVMIVSVITRGWNLWRKGEVQQSLARRNKSGIIDPVMPI